MDLYWCIAAIFALVELIRTCFFEMVGQKRRAFQKDVLSCWKKVNISLSKVSAYNLLLNPNPSLQSLCLSLAIMRFWWRTSMGRAFSAAVPDLWAPFYKASAHVHSASVLSTFSQCLLVFCLLSPSPSTHLSALRTLNSQLVHFESIAPVPLDSSSDVHVLLLQHHLLAALANEAGCLLERLRANQTSSDTLRARSSAAMVGIHCLCPSSLSLADQCSATSPLRNHRRPTTRTERLRNVVMYLQRPVFGPPYPSQ